MQTFTQKYTLIQLLENMPEGTEFPSTNWPLHVTIADTFATRWDVITLINKLCELLENHAQTTTIATNDEYFGPGKQTHVMLLNKTDELIALHYDIIALLEQGSVTFNDSKYTKKGFLPHATVQSHARLDRGDLVTFNALSLVDMFPNKDPYQRKIIKTIDIF